MWQNRRGVGPGPDGIGPMRPQGRGWQGDGFGPGPQGQGPWGPMGRRMGPGMGPGMGPMRRGMRGPGPGFGPGQMQALNLTAEQRTQLRQQHFTQSVAAEKLHSDMRIKRLELQQLMSSDTLDRAKVDAKMKELSDLRLQAQKARLDQREALMKALTPEQKEKLKTLGPGPGAGFAPGMRPRRPPQEEEQL